MKLSLIDNITSASPSTGIPNFEEIFSQAKLTLFSTLALLKTKLEPRY